DNPTSKVASAAQGYVELFGRSELLDGSRLVSTRTGLPCCWYRYYIERRTSNDKWEYVDSGESQDHFLLVDDTGRCVISPEARRSSPIRGRPGPKAATGTPNGCCRRNASSTRSANSAP
ncbi:MAG TPA: hypothetical protein VFK15_12355, partial [Burkholderiales bacterium]|nr:hypothetical protein [Burkholderiales bacterium]